MRAKKLQAISREALARQAAKLLDLDTVLTLATKAASARLVTFRALMMAETWIFTVPSAIARISAISLIGRSSM